MNLFNQRKKSVLEKEDKAAKASWDSRIIGLCNKLNSFENYYTTSSCSGKSIIMEEKVGKDGSYYLWTSHELISLEEIDSNKFEGKLIKFKSESPIVFVVCRNFDSAKVLLRKAVDSGFKESGIKVTEKLIAVEIKSGEKLEFPFFNKGDVLVSDEFLIVVVDQVNFKRKVGWEKIEKLLSSL